MQHFTRKTRFQRRKEIKSEFNVATAKGRSCVTITTCPPTTEPRQKRSAKCDDTNVGQRKRRLPDVLVRLENKLLEKTPKRETRGDENKEIILVNARFAQVYEKKHDAKISAANEDSFLLSLCNTGWPMPHLSIFERFRN